MELITTLVSAGHHIGFVLLWTIPVILIWMVIATNRFAKNEARVDVAHREYWNSIPFYAKLVAANLNLYRFGTPIFTFFGSLYGLQKLAVAQPHWILAAVLVLQTAYFIHYFFQIPVEDERGQPNIGLAVIAGVRIPRIAVPGWFLRAPGISIMLYQSSWINREIEFEGIRCRLDSLSTDGTVGNITSRIAAALKAAVVPEPEYGGKLTITASLSFQPNFANKNPWSLIDLDEAGGLEQAVDILVGAIHEDFRQMARRLTAEQLTFGSDIVSAAIIRDITGKKGVKIGTEERDILDNPDDALVTKYLETAVINGFSDAKGLGLKVRRVNIRRITPQGGLLEAAEKAAIARINQRVGVEDAIALGEAVEKLKEKLGNDHGMSNEELTTLVQIERGKQTRTTNIVRTPDADKIAEGVVRAIAHLTGKGGGS